MYAAYEPGVRGTPRTRPMLVRFECPACKGSHIFDMPETTIHMTCGNTREVLELRLTAGGDVKAAVVGRDATSHKLTSDTA